ncbi:MAG: hypothetical protein ACREF4_16275, partial [Gammaproteobacteria bacterium]
SRPFGCAATGPSERAGGREPEASHVALLTSAGAQRKCLATPAGAWPDWLEQLPMRRIRCWIATAQRQKLLDCR